MVAPAFSNSTTLARTRPTHFYFLDGLRGLASLWVLFFHVGAENVPVLASAMPFPLDVVLFDLGSLGVAIFFVLSGFVISYSLRQVTLSGDYLKNFTLRRWVRLSPPYYASIVLVIAFNILAANLKGLPFTLPTLSVFLGHLLYLQDVLGLGHISDVYWTICLEMQFYLLFCCVLWGAQRYARQSSLAATSEQFNYRTSQLVFVVGGFAAAVSPVFLEASTRPVWFIHQVYAFFLGVFAYWCWANRLAPALFYGYSALIWAGALVHQDHFAMMAVGTAIMLLQVAQLKRLSLWLAGPVMQFFGRISYSLYLIHVPIVGASLFLGHKLLGVGVWAESVSLLGALLLSTAAAAACWNFVERPSMAWSKKLKPKPVEVSPSTLSG